MLNVFVLGPLRKGYIYGLHAACTRRFPRRQRTRSRYNTGKAPKRNPVQALIGRVPGHRGDDGLHAVIARIFAPIFFLYRQLSYAQHSFDLNHGVLRVRRHGGDFRRSARKGQPYDGRSATLRAVKLFQLCVVSLTVPFDAHRTVRSCGWHGAFFWT